MCVCVCVCVCAYICMYISKETDRRRQGETDREIGFTQCLCHGQV